jgi:hypothetical protein
MHLLVALAAIALSTGPAADSNVAPCEKAFIGHGSADWRSESRVAGPVGVERNALQRMSGSGNDFVTKAPLLVEGRAPATVTVSVPPRLRQRVFLHYGNVLDRDGNPSTSFRNTRGYGETKFELCGNKPRTIWPGGIRVKGTAPVQLLVTVEGQPNSIPLRLGRPRAFEPS